MKYEDFADMMIDVLSSGGSNTLLEYHEGEIDDLLEKCGREVFLSHASKFYNDNAYTEQESILEGELDYVASILNCKLVRSMVTFVPH